MTRRVMTAGTLYLSYWVAVLYIAWGAVVLGFLTRVIPDSPTAQRAAFIELVSYWTPIAVFGTAGLGLVIARHMRWRYVASFAASIPPLYQLTVYLVYPITNQLLPVNFLGLVLWAWLLPTVVVLVHWEHERLYWIDAGAGDPKLAVIGRPTPPPSQS